VTSWKQLRKIWEDLFRNDGYDFSTVILDNLTEAQTLCKRGVMEDAKDRANNPDDIELEVPRQRDWGVLAERTMLMVRDFRDLPMNFICTAHIREEVNNKGQRKLKPALQGSSKQDVPGAFDIVAYLHAEVLDGNPVRLFSTRDTRDYVAKERDTDLPEHLANATMADILSYIPKGE
jgi:hypothetical protein